MSRLSWDNTGEHFYETGVQNVVIYPADAGGDYPLGEAWSGVTGITESPSGAESNAQYADNIKYLNLISTEEYGSTLTCFTYPNAFAECNGEARPVSGVTIGQQERTSFGLSYRTEVGNDTKGSDYAYKIHLVYGLKASPTERAYQTINDSPEAMEFSFELNSTPVKVTGRKPTSVLTIDSRDVSSAVLSELEDILWGTNATDPRLPLPDEIIGIVGAGVFDIVLNKANITLVEGETAQLIATTSPAGKNVTWSNGGSSKATVSDGVVTAVDAGTAVITASFTEDSVTYSDACNVTVVEPPSA